MMNSFPLSTGTATRQPLENHQGNNNSKGNGNDNKMTGCIQTNSVQDQFAALNRDRDQYRRESEQAKRELKHIQEGYQTLQEEQAELVTKNYQAQAELGDHTNKVCILMDDRARILRVTDNESRALLDCTNHTKIMEQKEVAAKKAFIDEMQTINDEMSSLLQRSMMLHTEGYVSAHSVSYVVAKIEKQNNCTLVNYKKHHDELTKLTIVRDEKRSQFLRLRQAVQQLSNNGTMEFAAMEVDSCQRDVDSSTANGTTTIPGVQGSEHMELFYGANA